MEIRAGGTQLDVITDHVQHMHNTVAASVNSDPLINEVVLSDYYPVAIGLYDDTTPADPSVKTPNVGTLRGWAALNYDFYDNKQSLKGTRVVDKFTDTILPDGSRKRRYVIEFATTQALGAINKIRLFGHSKRGSSRLHTTTDSLHDTINSHANCAYLDSSANTRQIYSKKSINAKYVYDTMLTQVAGEFKMHADTSVDGRLVVCKLSLNMPSSENDEVDSKLVATDISHLNMCKTSTSVKLLPSGDVEILHYVSGMWQTTTYLRSDDYTIPTVITYPFATVNGGRSTTACVHDGAVYVMSINSLNISLDCYSTDGVTRSTTPHTKLYNPYDYHRDTPYLSAMYYHVATDTFIAIAQANDNNSESTNIHVRIVLSISRIGGDNNTAVCGGQYDQPNYKDNSSENHIYSGYTYRVGQWSVTPTSPIWYSESELSGKLLSYDASRDAWLMGVGNILHLVPNIYCGPVLKLAESNIVEIVKTDEQSIRVIYEYTIKYERAK